MGSVFPCRGMCVVGGLLIHSHLNQVAAIRNMWFKACLDHGGAD